MKDTERLSNCSGNGGGRVGGQKGGQKSKRSTEGLICMHIGVTNGHGTLGGGGGGGSVRAGEEGDICSALCGTSRNKNYLGEKKIKLGFVYE